MLCLYDDKRDMFYPFSLLRPISELRSGMLTQGERIEKVTGLETSLLLTAPHIEEAVSGFSTSVPAIFLTSRFLPLIDEGQILLDAPPGSQV